MLKLVLLLLAAIAVAHGFEGRGGGGSTCTSPLLGTASGFSIFTLGSEWRKFDLQMNGGDSGGPIAVNGGMKVTNFGTNADNQNNCPYPNAFTLLVGGDLDYNGGELQCGSLLVAGNIINKPSVPKGQIVTGDLKTKGDLDFDVESKFLSELNYDLCATSGANAEVTRFGATTQIKFKGNANDPVQFFEVKAEDIDVCTFMSFDVPRSKVIVIVNVKGTTVTFTNFDMQLGGLKPENILFNFCDTKKIDIKNFGFKASILAPKGRIVFENAQIEGNVVSATLKGVGSAEVHFHPFVGVECPPA